MSDGSDNYVFDLEDEVLRCKRRLDALEKKVDRPLYYIGVEPCIPKSGLVYYSKYEKRSGKDRRVDGRRDYDEERQNDHILLDETVLGRRRGERRRGE